MIRALVLEDFEGGGVPDLGDFAAAPMPDDLPDIAETSDEESYEKGYRAGWDDCETQANEARTAVSAELARNLQELGFSFHEARSHVLSSIQPLLSAILTKLLPRMVAETFAPSILEELVQIAETNADAPVTILVSPASHDMVEGFLSQSTALPYKLVPEPTLGEWQVFFRLGDHEKQMDLDAVIERISARFAAFTDQNEKVLKHG